VALVDAYGPATSRASSGGETRVTRMGYGPDEVYTRWSWKSLEQWKALSARAGGVPLFQETGVLWMAHEEDPRSRATLEVLARVGVPTSASTAPSSRSDGGRSISATSPGGSTSPAAAR